MSDPASGWADPNPAAVTDSRTRTALTIAGAALTVLVIATLVVVVIISRGGIFSGSSPGQTIVLNAANAAGPDPFMPSVSAGAIPASGQVAIHAATLAQQLPYSAERGVRLVSGTQPGLYGSIGQADSCDTVAVANFLDTHPDNAKAWALAMGIQTAQIPYYLNTLTSVALIADAWVTSHSYTDGEVTAHQTVLQAGNAVLIDPIGVPRVACASGNPLTPPKNRNLSTLSHINGKPWDGYNPANVVAIAYTPNSSTAPQQTPPAPVTEFRLVDLITAQPLTRKAGGTINLEPSAAAPGQLPDPVSMNIPPAADG